MSTPLRTMLDESTTADAFEQAAMLVREAIRQGDPDALGLMIYLSYRGHMLITSTHGDQFMSLTRAEMFRVSREVLTTLNTDPV